MEDQISTIEKQYMDAFERFYKMATYTNLRNAEYANEGIKAALAFQRSIELMFEEIKKLSDDTAKSYIDRCREKVVSIGLLLRDRPNGVCYAIDNEEYYSAFELFRKTRASVYQFLEDVRLVYALRLYPIEEKITLKSMLTDHGFIEATRCLDEAKKNLAEKHFKDCIDRSREALEKTAASILVAEKKKPSGYFSTDMGTLSGLGIVDKESKKLIEATYSYLSEVGAHGRNGEVNLGDAHYAMKETYMRIDILLKKYVAYLARKE